MPLGIVDAAYIFTKITKPIMGSLRLHSLSLQVLRFLDSQKVKGVFIIPLWPTSVWFNKKIHNRVHCFQWVQKMVLFRPNFKPNINSPSCFAEFVTFDCAALNFDFSKSSLGERVIKSRSHCLLGGCDYC